MKLFRARCAVVVFSFAAGCGGVTTSNDTGDCPVPGVEVSLANALGFSPRDRILIVHADDLGLSPATNQAALDLMQAGVVTSASIIIPAPYAVDMIALARSHPELDFGIHLTLNSEWPGYRWGPIADDVPALVDGNGFLRRSKQSLFLWGEADQVEAELNAQVLRALALGLEPSHVDTHMGAVFLRPSYFRAYLNVAARHGLIPMIPDFENAAVENLGWFRHILPDGWWTDKFERDSATFDFPSIDRVVVDLQGETFSERKLSLLDTLRQLQPGVTQILIHPTYDDELFQDVMVPADAHELKRVADAQIFLDPEVRQLIDEQGIKQVNWRDIAKAWERLPPPPVICRSPGSGSASEA